MNSHLVRVVDLGRLAYERAYEVQVREVERVLADREAADERPFGTLLLVEHDPVITVSARQDARAHLVASPELLARSGVAVAQTDRGGDITYHGPGQLVVYPILDLNRLNLGLHAYMRLLEQAIIDVGQGLGLRAERDPQATGVWVSPSPDGNSPASEDSAPAKICAMGVRVRKWISMHGLALNVTTNLDHFQLIVPCGLVGRSVTSLERLLGPRCPSMDRVKGLVVEALGARIGEAHEAARAARAAVGG